MKIIPLQSERLEINPEETFDQWILKVLKENHQGLQDHDCLVITSKVVSYFEERVMDLSWIKPSSKARDLAKKMNTSEKLMELVLCEADEVIAETPWVLLTLKNGIYTANAGVDTSNVPKGHAVLWPKEPFKTAQNLKENLEHQLDLMELSIIISDSACIPGRKGTIAVAIGYAGISGYEELKGSKDLYENELRYSALNMVDSLATAANLSMGEGSEAKPMAIMRDFEHSSSQSINDSEMIIPKKEDMFPLNK